MSYVKHVLQPGEEVRHTASIHWILFLPGMLLLLASAAIFVYGRNADPHGIILSVIAAAIFIIAALVLFVEWFKWWTTEIAVTDRRVIQKTRLLTFKLRNFLRRETSEMHMDKIESVQVDQSLLGQLLGYGDVTVLGTGSGLETMRAIAAPIELRNNITGI